MYKSMNTLAQIEKTSSKFMKKLSQVIMNMEQLLEIVYLSISALLLELNIEAKIIV